MKKKSLFIALCLSMTMSLQANAWVRTPDSDNWILSGEKFIGENVADHGSVIQTGNTTFTGTINDCVFSNNTAGTYGGAIYNTAKLVITGSTFEHNKAGTNGGGAIFNNTGLVTIDKSIFKNNTATTKNGGAIYNSGATAELTITGSSFEDNTAKQYGGAIYNSKGTVTITDSSFKGNIADLYGGAIATTASTTITGTDFVKNSAQRGGAIFNQGLMEITGGTFEGNEATVDYGGAISSSGEFEIFGTVFNSNQATIYGGAIFINKLDSKNSIKDKAQFTANNAELGGAIYVNQGILEIDNVTFAGNTAKVGGGAIYMASPLKSGTNGYVDITIKNSTFVNNEAEFGAGAVGNFDIMTIEKTLFQNNKVKNASASGGALFLGSEAITTLDEVTFESNSSAGNGGAIGMREYNKGNNEAAKLDIINSTFKNNTAAADGGAIHNTFYNSEGYPDAVSIKGSKFEGNKAGRNGGAIYNEIADKAGNFATVTIEDSSFINNSAVENGGAIFANSDLNILSKEKNILFSGNSAANGGDIYMAKEGANLRVDAAKGRTVTFEDGISGNDNGYNIIIGSNDGKGTVILESEIKNAVVKVQNGTLKAVNATFINSSVNMSETAIFDAIDGKFNDYSDILKAEDGMKIKTDISTSTGQTDILGSNIKGNVHLLDFKPTADTLFSKGYIDKDGLKEMLGLGEDATLTIESGVSHTVLTPLRRITATSDEGGIGFAPTGNSYKDFNPAVMASPIAAQLGGYLTQLNSYDEAFRNMDMYMLMTKSQRKAMKLRNKYAAADGNLVFNPTGSVYDDKAVWVRPYATFENVPLKGGPRVSNVAYGSFFGVESELQEHANGWDTMYGVYAGYNGSHQAYDGISIYQNGGTLGLVGMAYKGNFFTGLTVNAGANVGEASTFYGNDNFSMLMAGIANKTGYNIELADGKFIIQPSLQLSYSFVNTFDYKNAAGIHINSDPLNAIQVEPGIKFIGNLKNGWQPYAGVSVVWNIMDKTHFHANDATLPDLSVKPFVRYGIGVRKTWGERLTGFFQTYFTNGGRNGVGLQVGFRMTLGKGGNGSISKGSVPELPKTQIKLSNIK